MTYAEGDQTFAVSAAPGAKLLLTALFGLLSVGLLPASLAAQTTPQIVYIAFGDSITEGVGDDPSRASRGYPARLEGLLSATGSDPQVINAGVPGEDTSEGLTRIDGVLRQGGDVLLLMEGTNDLGPGISEETTRANLNQMATKAERQGLEVIHATVIPRLPTARLDADNQDTQRMNEQIRDLAGNQGRELADPFEVFSSLPTLYSNYYDDAPGDRVGHPNEDGYDVLAQVFADVIREEDTVPPVTGILNPPNGVIRVPPGQTVSVEVWDFGTGINLANTDILVNGSVVEPMMTGNSRHATYTYRPPNPFSGAVEIGLRSADFANPPNQVDKIVSRFIIRGTRFLDGDLDQDGRVDGADLVLFARTFGSTQGDGRYDRFADFNDDAVIDGDDLALLAANFGDSNF